MPSKLKKLVRRRMAKTGERYVAALAHVRAEARLLSSRLQQHEGRVPEVSAELIVARYFGQEVTLAIVPTQGRCVLMVAPRSALPLALPPRPSWRMLGQRGEQ